MKVNNTVILVVINIVCFIAIWLLLDSKISPTKTKEIHTIEKTIDLREFDTKVLENNIKELKKQISQLERSMKTIEKDIPKFIDRDKYFNKRYMTEENEVKDNKIVLGDSTTYKIIYELEEKDILSNILPLKNTHIVTQDSIIYNLKQNKLDMTHIRELENELNRKNQKKKDRRNTFEKVGTFAIGVAGGFLISRQ